MISKVLVQSIDLSAVNGRSRRRQNVFRIWSYGRPIDRLKTILDRIFFLRRVALLSVKSSYDLKLYKYEVLRSLQGTQLRRELRLEIMSVLSLLRK